MTRKFAYALALAGQLVLPPAASAAEPAICPQISALPADADAGERLYAAGACALVRQDYREAIRLLEMLVTQDAHPVYRADLGRAYLGAQQFEQARKQFQLALESAPPDNARRLLQVFLQMAEQEQTQAKAWFASAAVGQVYDSNINSGPLSKDVTLFGLPFTMNDSAMPKSDRALHAAFSAVHTQSLGDGLSWQTNSAVDLMRYQTYGQYDTSQVNVDTGPHFSLGKGRADLYLPVGVGRTYLNSAPYTTTRSIAPQLRYSVSNADMATLNLPVANKTYSEAPAMSSNSRGISLAWRHALSEAWVLEPSLRYVRENATDPAYSNIQRSLSLSLRGSLPAQLRFSGEVSATRAGYAEAEFWADAARRDTRLNYALSLSRDLAGGYYLSLSWLRMRTLSNLALYSSERTQVQVQISKSF